MKMKIFKLFKKLKMEKEVLVELINEQLRPYKKTYYDVEKTHNWFMNYSTTREEQSDFMAWGVEYLIENLNMSRKLAEVEISWFILQWGLVIEDTQNKEVAK
tara:strand:+ start:7176 stop:7481 length:306 start_codon:yes stop_codon:yes gene_type:complete